MECTIILKGSYYDEHKLKEDVQYINLFNEGTPLNLSFDNRIIEDAWYKLEVKIEGFYDEAIDRIEFFVNDEQIHCDISDYLNKGSAIHLLLELPEDKKQLFLLYYEFVSLRLIIYSNDSFKVFSSNEVPCVSKNIFNYKNVGQMIAEILEFEDEEINNWIYNIHCDNTNSTYGVIQGAYKRNALKSIYSYLQLLKEIYNSYHKNLYLFKNQIKHVIVNQERTIPFTQVKRIGQNEFQWIMHNAEELKETQGNSGVVFSGVNYLPRKMKTHQIVRDKDVYENRVVYSFLRIIVTKLLQIKNAYNIGVNREKEILSKLKNFREQGLHSPIVLIKESQLEKWNIFVKELETLSELFQKLLLWYKDVLNCQEIKLETVPRKTKTFQAIKHYNEIYNLIIKWYKYGDFNLYKETLLLRVKKVDKIFEYYCLMHLLKKAKNMGYIIDQKTGGAQYFYYRLRSRYEGELDVNNTYSMTDGQLYLTIYYQPVLFSSDTSSTNNISLFRTDTDFYWMPDFIIKIHNTKTQKDSYAILDAKYSNRKNIREKYLPQELMKYVCSVADKNGETPSVRLMWLLQGRDHNGEQLENFHKSKLAKLVKPIPSYGIYILNPSSSNTDKLWDEIIRCLS